MPWSEDAFPTAMRHLDPRTRSKAVEIANALLGEGCEEGFAIRVAITNSRTRLEDIDFLVESTLRIGARLAEEGA